MSSSAEQEREDATLTQTLDLVRQGQAGDRQAIEKLFVRYCDVIRRIVVLRAGAALRKREEFDDIVQATMLEVFQSLDKLEYRGHREFVAYLARITVNKIRGLANHHNAIKRGRDVAFLQQIRSTLTGPADLSGPSTVIARRDEFDHIMDCALELPDGDRKLLALFLVHGEDWGTIGGELGLTNDAARMRWARTRARLASLSLERRQGGAARDDG